MPDAMDPSTSAAALQAARDKELRGECAKAFALYEQGNLECGTELLQKLLARHPAHPLLHCAYVRMVHMQLLEQRQPASIMKQRDECLKRILVAFKACPGSLLPPLLMAQVVCDDPTSNGELEHALNALRMIAANAVGKPISAADFEYAKAIASFDDEMFTLALMPDVRECTDFNDYWTQGLACLAKAPAKIVDRPRLESEIDHFITLRDNEHAAVATQRLLHVEANQALAAVPG